MVENQIPTFILKRILLIERSETEDSVEEYLGSMLLSFCEKHCSVLKLTQTPKCSEAFKHCHLLDLLYHLIVSEHEKPEKQTFESEEAPVVVTIPSLCELFSVGIRFKPSEGGIKDIHFDKMKGMFYLHVIKLDVNSEVIMRNIVAYEALTQPDSLVFTRYTELMRAIIDTVEDVKLLKKAQIIEKTSSLSVEETTDLFNGMSKSIGPTKTKKLDETIQKVNKYFHDKRKGNLYWIFTNYVYSSWKFFTLLSTFVLLAMTALEALCSVYDCRSHFRLK
ncbi:putative UPF0481 protein At3g02645 [Gastrolobium bilobum]|uniref:putative UPF0481 protein At3g02645 n=1 Tax=Gastrolobium bilobum TaxID=150636 RepID=UPI002AB0ACCA|nr:putative UPF0481 protein At3g02645 [Gastrolobium bilobum]